MVAPPARAGQTIRPQRRTPRYRPFAQISPKRPAGKERGGKLAIPRKSCNIFSMRRSKFSGVYSLTAQTSGKRNKAYYFVWQLPDGDFAVQALNIAFKAVSEAQRISAAAFQAFTEEPSILAMPVVTPDLSHFESPPQPPDEPDAPEEEALAEPALQNVADKLGGRESVNIFEQPRLGKASPAAEKILQEEPAPATETPAAEPRRAYDLEAVRKARVTESRLRETFRQTLLRLKRPRERKAALAALKKLAETTEDILPLHKHMFRDFGVRLRQNSLPDLALLFSRKTVELSPEDDHAHFNLARILCSLGMYDEAAAHVRTAMSMGEEPVYFKMLVHIRKEKLRNSSKTPSGRKR